jgi:hypothetical protein
MGYIKIGKYGGLDETKPTYQFKEVLDVDYVDSTDVFMWFEAQNYADKDYLYCRENAMIYIANIGGFSSLTSETHKELAVQNFCVGKDDRDSVYDDNEQELFWYVFIVKSEKCRSVRWDKAKSFASYRLSIVDSNDLAEDTNNLNVSFVKYGITSFNEDGKDGLVDWLLSQSSFSGGGFENKTYFTLVLQSGIIELLNGK